MKKAKKKQEKFLAEIIEAKQPEQDEWNKSLVALTDAKIDEIAKRFSEWKNESDVEKTP